jgi:DNA-binding MarR family transcriptional regulator
VPSARAEDVLDALETFLGRLHCAAQHAGLDTFVAADLSLSQLRSLLVLAQRSTAVPIHELAATLGLSVASAGRNVDQLVRVGLVDRSEDESDRRIKRIRLTASGRDLVAGFRARRRNYALGVVRSLGAEDRDRVLTALRSVNEKMAGCQPLSAEGSDFAPPRPLQESFR